MSFHEILAPIAFPNGRALLVGQYGPAAWECSTDIQSTHLRFLYLKNRRRNITAQTQAIPKRLKITLQVVVQHRPRSFHLHRLHPCSHAVSRRPSRPSPWSLAVILFQHDQSSNRVSPSPFSAGFPSFSLTTPHRHHRFHLTA